MSDPEDVPAKRPIDPPREYGEAPSLLERLNREIRNHKCTLHMDGRNRYPDGLVAEAAARIAELEARAERAEAAVADEATEHLRTMARAERAEAIASVLMETWMKGVGIKARGTNVPSDKSTETTK